MSVIEENWNYQINLNEIERKYFDGFELLAYDNRNESLKLLEDNFLQSINNQTNSAQSYDEELKLLVEKNKQVRREVELKLKEVSQQKSQYESYKQDKKLLTQEIKETHEAFLMAKKYYKKYLKMYYTVKSKTDDKQIIHVQFFTEAKKESENYSIKLIRNMKSKEYELLSTTPKLKVLKEYQRILQDTNDVPGTLFYIREEFMELKKNKK